MGRVAEPRTQFRTALHARRELCAFVF